MQQTGDRAGLAGTGAAEDGRVLAEEGVRVDPDRAALQDGRLTDGDAEAGLLRVRRCDLPLLDGTEDRVQVGARCQVHRAVEHRKQRDALSERVAVDRADECRLHQAPGRGEGHHGSVGLHLRFLHQNHARHHRHKPPPADWDDHVGVDAPDLLGTFVCAPAHTLQVTVQLDADLRRVDGDHAPDLEVSRHPEHPPPQDRSAPERGGWPAPS